MNNVVTWEYYNSLHNKASQNEFSNLEALAEKYVQLIIGYYRWSNIKESAFYFGQLRDCICDVIDKLVDLNSIGAGNGVASVSNDGYSESYAVRTVEEYNNEIRTCIIRGLSGTGLVGAFPLGG